MISSLRTRPRLRLAVFVALVGAVAGATALLAPHSPGDLRVIAQSAGILAPVAFVIAWTLLTIALFPGTVLAAAGGLLFGPLVGTLLSIAGATLGGTAAFLVARHGARGSFEAVAGERIMKLSSRIERRGLLAMICARAAPGVPATGLHYAAGASRVKLWHFAAGIAIGGAPRVFAYTAIGGSLDDPTSPAALAAISIIAGMALATAAIAWRARRRTRRAAAAV